MPYTTHYADDGKGVHKTGTGLVTGSELIASALQQGLDEERTRKLRYGLVDFTGATEMKVTPDDIRRLVELNRKVAAFTKPGALVAIVAPTELPYAISRLWHTFSGDLGWKANVFRTRADAVEWLRKELLAREDSSDALDQFPSLQRAP